MSEVRGSLPRVWRERVRFKTCVSLLIECALCWEYVRAGTGYRPCVSVKVLRRVSMCGHVETPERVAKHPSRPPSRPPPPTPAVFLSMLLETQYLNGVLPTSGEN